MLLNITSGSEDPRVNILSNLALSPFNLEDVMYASVEGALQGIKFQDKMTQKEIFSYSGKEALKKGRKKTKEGPDFVWLHRTEKIGYNSVEHREFIMNCLRAKFEQNELARICLMATKHCELVHKVGHEHQNTSLPAHVFIRMLEAVREECFKPTKKVSIDFF